MKLFTTIYYITLLSGTFAAINKPPMTTTPASTTSSLNINSKLRKALIEALSKFEGGDSTESSYETTTITSEEIEDVTNNPAIINVHSFSIRGDKSNENEIIKTIIISRPKTTLTPPIPTVEDDQVHIKFGSTPNPIDTYSQKSENFVSQRSVDSRIMVDRNKEKNIKKASESSATKPISQQKTTMAIVSPDKISDGENTEKVSKDGVKIFQAPLLAAFTVQQDINGQPNKVISLLKNPEKKISTKDNNEKSQSTQMPFTLTSSTPNVSRIPEEQRKIISIYEQKQRQLEEQIKTLQARQREQEEFIKRHQILEQTLRFEEEQKRKQEQHLLQSQTILQPQVGTLLAPLSSSTSNVQFIQSIPVGHTIGISVEQQLPFKGPVEFNPDKPDQQKSLTQRQQQFQLKQFRKQQHVLQNNQGFMQNFPTVQKLEVKEIAVSQLPTNLELPVKSAKEFHSFNRSPTLELELPTKSASNFNSFATNPNLELPVRLATEFNILNSLPTSLELPQKSFQTFNSAPLSVLPSITDIVPHLESRNRVFRNDAVQTGNFGFNPSVQIQQQQILPIQGAFDVQLQSLLSQSGITSRSAEDFRLISKVLSLNHGIPNNLPFY